MLDTGAKISVIEYDIIKTIKTIKIDKSNLEVRCANGSQIKVKGKAKLKITIGNHCKMIEFQVTEGVIPKLIGEMNLLNAFDIWLMQNTKQGVSYIERNICSNKTNKVDPEIQKILEGYHVILMKHKWDIGLTKLTKHNIITEGPPAVINPRRQPSIKAHRRKH